MQIKICGNSSLKDTLAIAQLKKINYLGFIMAYPKSPRNTTPAKVAKIINQVKTINSKIKFVGVFVNQPIEKVKKIIKQCQLDIVQLHGDETPEYCLELKKYVKVWKAIILKNKNDIDKIKQYKKVTNKILLDAGRGSGKQIDYKLLKNIDVDILAGGLSAKNVKQAVKKIDPKIVDLVSGSEIAPGKKDVELVREIIQKLYG